MKYKFADYSLYIILILLFLILSIIFVEEYVNNEIEQYKGYNDFTRGDIVMTLSYNKDPLLQYHAIRYVQSFNTDNKVSKGDLIYDFASYEFIPILNYLNKKSENVTLINSFSKIMNFMLDFNSATIGLAENILVEQSNGKYYVYEKGIYTYKVKKDVISKEMFEKMYSEYLASENCINVDENIAYRLFKNKNINSLYSYSEIKDNINYNYEKFYESNEDLIVIEIANDLEKFANFLYKEYLFIDSNDKRYLKKNIDTSILELSFNFTEGDRIYNAASKYYTHNYKLDINDVWEQLAEKGYPKIYS